MRRSRPVRMFGSVSALLCWLVLATFGSAAFAQAQPPLPAGVTRVTEVEGITEYALANGLHVLLLPDPSKPVTTVNLTLRVGSRMENYGETGMAHLLEHLLFKGTPRHPDPKREMSDRGLSWNGTTSDDRTNYFASMAENPANLDFYLGWLGEALTQSFIAKKDLDSEMTVVRNEMESGENDPGNVLFQNVRSSAFRWHNYGKSTIGARADVENVDVARLQAFYRKYYQPDNAVLIVAGKFDEARTLATVASSFGRIPKPTRVLEPTYTLDPAQDGERSVMLRRVGDTPIVLAMYHVPAGASPDFPAALLASVMLGGPEFRLHKALVEKNLAASAFGSARPMAEPGYAYFGAQLKSDQPVDAARDALLAAVEGSARTPFTPAELERAKNIWLRGFAQTLDDPQRVGIALSEYVALGDWRLGFDRRDRIKAVTLEDVNRVAAAYFVTSNRTLGTFIPSAAPVRAPAPQKVDVAAVMKDFKGGEAVARGESFDVSPENIDKRTTFGTLHGPAGVRTAFLPKATRGAKVVAIVTLRLGDEKTLFGKDVIGSATASMLARGTERLSREQLAAEFEKLRTSWDVGGGPTGASIRLETTKQNLAASVALASEVLKTPRFDAGEFEQMKAGWVSSIEESRSEPRALLRERLDRHGNPYPKGDVRYAMTFDETLKAIAALKLDDVRAFHREFYGASRAIVSAVGDFDPGALGAQLTREIGGWTSRTAYTRVAQPAYDIPPLQFRIEVKDKQNAEAAGRLQFALRESDREFQALRLATHIFGGASGRLWDRVREKDGLSYGVGAYIAGGLFEPNADWGFYAITAPQNADRVHAAFDEEALRARREGFTENELTRAKEAIASASRLARAQDATLARTFVSFVERDKTPRYFAEIDALRASITLDEVNAAFRKYMVPEKMVFGVAGDFAGATAATKAAAAR
ncbi:M16 family metallopeptidase [Piscinibacter koreensis]|uniref:Insulinase family protein n=1 Tax=Piscinibacter koreensis TaxID=2742824 RepID=A0A7Y6NRK1_9BURK|nr:pitrilysin family protein [Schlegelella koreensis]NUZ08048.1 insulinase family protein [Schlegelella koreensis]